MSNAGTIGKPFFFSLLIRRIASRPNPVKVNLLISSKNFVEGKVVARQECQL